MANDIATLSLKIDAKQVKKGTEDLKKLGDQAEKTEKRAISMGKAFGAAFLAYGGGKIFSSVISNTIEQERVTAQLEATLKSTGNYTEELSENLQEYAAQLQKVTTFGDEAIVASEALLLTFRKIGSDVFPRAEMAVLDVATAMSIDLKSAAIQVGKALNDPAIGMSALSRSGITFTQVQKDLVKGFLDTNQLAKAQNVILTELEAQFGGSAKAAKDTLGGAIISLQNSFGDLLEGDKGSTTEVIASLNELTETLNEPATKQGFQAIVTGVFALTNQFVGAVTEIVEFDHWLGVIGKKYLGIDFAERAVDSMIRLNDEISELQEELKELDLSDKGKNPEAFYIRSEIAKASKELAQFTKQAQEDLKPAKAPVIEFGVGSDEAVTANKALTKTLENAQKEAAKTAASFEKMYQDITKAAAGPDSKVTSIDIGNVQLQAQSAINAGDFDGAIAKAKEGFTLIEQMKDAGNLSDSLVEYYAKQFKTIGDDAGKGVIVDAQIDIDTDLARQNAIQAGDAMQEALDANPLVQIVELKWADGTTPNNGKSVVPNTATSVPKQPQLQPAIINLPSGGSHTVYGDPETIDSFAAEIAREATKRGTR